jgi:hypothetical protein
LRANARGCGVLSALVFCLLCNLSAARNQEKPMTQQDPMSSRRTAYVSLVVKAQGDGFKPVPKAGAALSDRALFGSLTWCERIFRVPIHGPKDEVEHSYHVSNPRAPIDLLLHRLSINKVPVRIYEASPFFLVIVPSASLRAEDPAAKSALAATMLLSADPPFAFQPISATANPSDYSTDPERKPMRIGDWKKRIDSIVLDTDLALVAYKATYDDMITMMSDPSAWFQALRTTK